MVFSSVTNAAEPRKYERLDRERDNAGVKLTPLAVYGAITALEFPTPRRRVRGMRIPDIGTR